MSNYNVLFLFLNGLLLVRDAYGLPEQGQWSFTVTQSSHIGVVKSLYKDSVLKISVSCSSDKKENSDVKIGWMMRQTHCSEEYLNLDNNDFQQYYKFPYQCITFPPKIVRYIKTNLTTVKCTSAIFLKPHHVPFKIIETTQDCPRIGDEFSGPYMSNPDSENEPEKLPVPQAQSEKKPSEGNARVKRDQKPSSDIKKISLAVNNATDHLPVSDTKVVDAKEQIETKNSNATETPPSSNPRDLLVIDHDGVYLLVIYVSAPDEANFTVSFDISLKGPHGYLSAVDWPLLPFYAFMCGIYVIYAVVWLTVSAMHWRELLRIQFWIGGVILLGLIEKTVFYGEYQYINSTGQAAHGGMLFAEVFSCFKRTLARLLVIIVSLGFGIVKPRLGSVLHRIIGIGTLYFVLCSVEGCLRVIKSKNDLGNQTMVAGIPLAVLDSGICWWIFSSLVHTTRTLKLRRNVVKLSLYRHFTNTLIFSVLASVVYMMWSLYNHKLTNCLSDWKELWVDEAYWHLLFSLLLLVIMCLFRPTINNQRYAFTPLLDTVDEEEEDLLEKESSSLNDVYGTKVRGAKNQSTSASKKEDRNGLQQEDDLKWVDENIPSLSDTALPRLLDSDEEIMTVRFERNKME